MKKNYGNNVVKKAIIWAMTFMMTFTPVFGSVGSMTALAANDENGNEETKEENKETKEKEAQEGKKEEQKENKPEEKQTSENTDGSSTTKEEHFTKEEQKEAFKDAYKENAEAQKAEVVAGVSAVLTIGNGIIKDEAGAVVKEHEAGHDICDADQAIREGNKEVNKILDNKFDPPMDDLDDDESGSLNKTNEESIFAKVDEINKVVGDNEDVYAADSDSNSLVASTTEANTQATNANTSATSANNGGTTTEYVDQAAYDAAKAEYDKNVTDYETAKQAANDALEAATNAKENASEKLLAANKSYEEAEQDYNDAREAYIKAEEEAAAAKAEAEAAIAAGLVDANIAMDRAEAAYKKAGALKLKMDEAQKVTQGWVDALGGEKGSVAVAKENLNEATGEFIEALANVGKELTSQDEDGLQKTGQALLQANEALVAAASSEFKALGNVAEKAAAVAEIELKKVAAEKALEVANEAVGKMETVDESTEKALEAAKQAVAAANEAYEKAKADLVTAKVEEAAKKQAEKDAETAKDNAINYEFSEEGQSLSILEKNYADAKDAESKLAEDASEEEKTKAAQAKADAEQALVSAAIKEQLYKEATVEVQENKDSDTNNTVYKVTTTVNGEDVVIYYESVENEDGTISLYDYQFDERSNINYNKTEQSEVEKDAFLKGFEGAARKDGNTLVEGVDYVVECTREHEDAEYTVVYSVVTQNSTYALEGAGFIYEEKTKAIYNDQNNENVVYTININGTEYPLKAITTDLFDLVYELRYQENGDWKRIPVDVNVRGFSYKRYETKTDLNVTSSNLGNYENYSNVTTEETKAEVPAQYTLTYYDVKETLDNQTAGNVEKSLNIVLSEEDKAKLANGEEISTVEYSIKLDTPETITTTYDIQKTSNITKKLKDVTTEEWKYNVVVKGWSGFEHNVEYKNGKYGYTDYLGKWRVLGEGQEVTVKNYMDVQTGVSEEKYNELKDKGYVLCDGENSIHKTGNDDATYSVIYYNTKDRYHEIQGTEGDGTYTNVSVRTEAAVNAYNTAKDEHDAADKALIAATAKEGATWADLQLKEGNQRDKQAKYNLVHGAYTEAQKKLEEAQKAYDAYYSDKKLTWEEVTQKVKSPISGEEIEVTVKVPVYSSQYAKDLAKATLELAAAGVELKDATTDLKIAAGEYAEAFGAHSAAVIDLVKAVDSMNKAAGNVIVQAGKLGIEDAKLVGATIANDAVLAAGKYLTFVQNKADKAFREAEEAQKALLALQNKINVSDEELAAAKLRLENAENALTEAQTELGDAQTKYNEAVTAYEIAQANVESIIDVDAWNATVRRAGNGSGSSSSSRKSSSSSSSTSAATLSLIDDETVALAATLEDTTFEPEFTTIDDQLTALADTITPGKDSILKTGDTSVIPMVASTAMAMGFVSIAGAYGLKRRRSKKNQ